MGLFPYDRDAMLHDGVGLGTAAFALLLVGGLALGLLGLLVSGGTLVRDALERRAFVEAGIVAPGARVEAWHPDPADADAGCLLADGVLVRWEDGRRVAELALLGATATRDGASLDVAGAGATLRCHVGDGPDADGFAAFVALRTSTAPPARRTWTVTDPRLREHYGLEPASSR